MASLALVADDSHGGSGSDDGPNSGGGSDSGDGEDGAPSTVERVVMVASVALTLALFAFVAWSAVTGPSDANPRVTVERLNASDDGPALFAVHLRNPADRGLEHATVVVECGDPPRTLDFEHVPSHSERRATVACPSGTSDPPASVVSWRGG